MYKSDVLADLQMRHTMTVTNDNQLM